MNPTTEKICGINAVEGFDPASLALDYVDLITGETRKRLPVMAQIAWFRRRFVPEQRGILIPVRDLQGRIQGLQIRRDNAQKRKFRWVFQRELPGGLPRRGLDAFRWPCARKILLIEGPLKADVVHRITGQTVLAVPGVNALTQLEQTLLELRGLDVRHVMTAFDMDFLRNFYVQSGYAALTQTLVRLGFHYGTYLWNPNYNGLDDFVWGRLRGGA
jgi:hypothetical protein